MAHFKVFPTFWINFHSGEWWQNNWWSIPPPPSAVRTQHTKQLRCQQLGQRIDSNQSIELSNIHACPQETPVLTCSRCAVHHQPPGALLGGERSRAGQTRQRKQQRFGQDERLPEPGAGGLAAQESIQDWYKPSAGEHVQQACATANR